MTIYLNQRSKDRSRIGGEIQYSHAKGGAWYDADLKDCNCDGLSFSSRVPYIRGTQIVLKSKNKTDVFYEDAEIKWSKLVSPPLRKNSRYRVGAKFSAEIV